MITIKKIRGGYRFVNHGDKAVTDVQSTPPGVRLDRLEPGRVEVIVSAEASRFKYFDSTGVLVEDVPVEP